MIGVRDVDAGNPIVPPRRRSDPERKDAALKTVAILAAVVGLAVAASAALAAPPKVIGTKKAAVVRISANDAGYTPKNIAVRAGAKVTLRWKVTETNFGHGLFGKLFTIKRIEAGTTGIATFKAPSRPGKITFRVTWPDNAQMKYTATILVVK